MRTSSSFPFADDAAQPVVVEADEVLFGDSRRMGARPHDARVGAVATAQVDLLGHERRHLELDPRARRRLRRIGEDEPAQPGHLHRAVLVVHEDLGVEALEVGGSLTANVTRLLVPVRGRNIESLRRTEIEGATNITVSSSMSATSPSSSSNGRPPDRRDRALLVRPDGDGDLVDRARAKRHLGGVSRARRRQPPRRGSTGSAVRRF